ncbi:MAG: FtsX-like permease family protein, partial [Acidimicrobiales bacterium]|nr:FtsX-like permease family protein [Acidimicrobiales bacterium]
VDGGGFELGDEITLISGEGRETFTLVGISSFGAAESAGGAIFIGTTLAEGQRLAGEEGRVDTIMVRAEEGTSPEQLVEQLDDADLAPELDIVTGQQAADEQASDVKSGFAFFTIMLTVFALIALVVGWFIISNTFGILVAQRTRELALLRAIGAGRGQVLGSVFLEAAIIGILSSILGFFAGVALAAAAFAGLAAAGLDLPTTSLVIQPAVAVFAVAIGLVVTGIAAIGPAIKATRVAPIEALRATATDESGRSKIRLGAGLLALVGGLVLVAPAFGDLPTSDQLPGIGGGLFLILASVLVLGPVLARPLAAAVGWWIPKVRGITGTLARQNAMRSPRRTASTAAALIIGVTLVSFITIFASSAQASISEAIGTGFEGDYIVQPINQFTLAGVTPEVADEIAAIDGVETVTALAFIDGQLTLPDGSQPGAFIGGVDPDTFGDIFAISMADGTLDDLEAGTIVVDQAVAKQEGVAIGDEISVLSRGGRTSTFTVSAISDDPALLGQWTVTKDDAADLTPDPSDYLIGIRLADDVPVESVRQPIKDVLEPYPTMKVQDRDQYTSSIVTQISALLNVIYALLAVSIVIAVIGIANTLRLSIHERTRELGLLRATGMTRGQLRASVRWEAVIVALMGTGIGIALGIGLSWIMVKALVSQGITEFSVSPTGMITVVVFGAALGVIASINPARRAAKLNVLDAIASE